ncbi:MAG: hypothetical protein WBP45_04945 [Daejeonella sp.]
MRKISLLVLTLIILMNSCKIGAPNKKLNPESQLIRYYNVSVNFTSMGAGINREAYDELSAYMKQVQKELNNKLLSETMNWGREGERLIYFELSQLSEAEGREFYLSLKKMFQDKSKMAVVERNLYYKPHSNQLMFNVPLSGQNQYREEALLEYITAFEKANAVKINTGRITKPTPEVEGENPWLLDLNKLSAEKQKEVIENSKALMKVGGFRQLTVTIKSTVTLSGLKEYLLKFIQDFEKNYNLKLDYTNKLYGVSGSNELFTFDLRSLNENTKGDFIRRLKQLFASNKEQVTIEIN